MSHQGYLAYFLLHDISLEPYRRLQAESRRPYLSKFLTYKITSTVMWFFNLLCWESFPFAIAIRIIYGRCLWNSLKESLLPPRKKKLPQRFFPHHKIKTKLLGKMYVWGGSRWVVYFITIGTKGNSCLIIWERTMNEAPPLIAEAKSPAVLSWI